MYPPDLIRKATHVLELARARRLKIATAESCTGGLIAGCLTEIAGSSDVVERGFVTYTNEAKHELLGVPMALFATVGAVSEEVARAMAEGALERARADMALACTGIAGPGGATAQKPVGLVHIALARRGQPTRHLRRNYGAIGRTDVRLKTVEDALDLATAAIGPD
ncbi:MAG: CinA family protein [Alphaproteobacteria bacterium]|nr:CinA family protein [Alphaproteobacteria bacterium]